MALWLGLSRRCASFFHSVCLHVLKESPYTEWCGRGIRIQQRTRRCPASEYACCRERRSNPRRGVRCLNGFPRAALILILASRWSMALVVFLIMKSARIQLHNQTNTRSIPSKHLIGASYSHGYRAQATTLPLLCWMPAHHPTWSATAHPGSLSLA